MTEAERVPSVRLALLLEGLADVVSENDRKVTSVALDSRKVCKGGLFLACAGQSRHGLAFLSQALQNGAAAVAWEPDANWTVDSLRRFSIPASVTMLPVAELRANASRIAGRFYGNPGQDMLLIGITGTNGKTSCTQYIARAMAPTGLCGTVGTLGIGFPDALQEGTHTTPDPVALQSALADFKRAGADAVAMEVSSHALDQGRVAAVGFDVAVFTNLSRDHLDYHGSFSAYGEAKKRLFQMPGVKTWVVNLDDAFGQALLSDVPEGVTTIGYGQGADRSYCKRVTHTVWANAVQSDDSGMRIDLETSWGAGQINTRLLGRFNVSNLLAVAAVLLQQQIPLATVLERMTHLTTVPGRMERFGGNGQPLVIVDYAHTPDALEHVLAASRAHTEGRLICVFGCGGDRDRGKRPQMGEVAQRLADLVVLTDDNPRSENPRHIVTDILSGIEQRDKVRVEHDRAAAIRSSIAAARPDDLVLVAGKGHEDYQESAGERRPFSDIEQVQLALGGEA